MDSQTERRDQVGIHIDDVRCAKYLIQVRVMYGLQPFSLPVVIEALRQTVEEMEQEATDRGFTLQSKAPTGEPVGAFYDGVINAC